LLISAVDYALYDQYVITLTASYYTGSVLCHCYIHLCWLPDDYIQCSAWNL